MEHQPRLGFPLTNNIVVLVSFNLFAIACSNDSLYK